MYLAGWPGRPDGSRLTRMKESGGSNPPLSRAVHRGQFMSAPWSTQSPQWTGLVAKLRFFALGTDE
jgi:hypothetical protein